MRDKRGSREEKGGPDRGRDGDGWEERWREAEKDKKGGNGRVGRENGERGIE